MRYTYRKDKLNRQVFSHNEKTLRYNHVIRKDQSLNPQYKFFALNETFKAKKGVYRGHVKNHCILTFRCNGIMSKFKLSRIKFREMANNGDLAGIRNSSW